MLCEDETNRVLSIWIQLASLEDILHGACKNTASWNKVGEVNISSSLAEDDVSSIKGIVGAQFDIPEEKDDDDDGDFNSSISSFNFGVSVLLDRGKDGSQKSVLRLDVVWSEDQSNSQTYDILASWLEYDHQLYEAICKQTDDIYAHLKDVCGISDVSLLNEKDYRRVDFCWVPKSFSSSLFSESANGDCDKKKKRKAAAAAHEEIAAEEDEDELTTSVTSVVGDVPIAVVRKRGRPTGKKDSKKRTRSIAISQSACNWCHATVIKILFLCGSPNPLIVNKKFDRSIAGLFTLTDIFPIWYDSKKSDPIERRIGKMFGELQLALDDNPLLLKDFSSGFCNSMPAETILKYNRLKIRIKEWLEKDAACDFFADVPTTAAKVRGSPASTSSLSLLPATLGWGTFNKDEMTKRGLEKLERIILEEKTKKCGVDSIWIPSSSSSTPCLSGSWREIQEQFAVCRKNVVSEVNTYYKHQRLNKEEEARMKQHKKQVDIVFEKMSNAMLEAVAISRETDQLVHLIASLQKRRDDMKTTLESIIPEASNLTHFCCLSSLPLLSADSGVEHVVNTILEQSQSKLLPVLRNSSHKLLGDKKTKEKEGGLPSSYSSDSSDSD